MHVLKIEPKTVGAKQTLKALNEDNVISLFIAKDAQVKVTTELIEIANKKQIPVVYVDTMAELGKACDIEVKTATAALIKK